MTTLMSAYQHWRVDENHSRKRRTRPHSEAGGHGSLGGPSPFSSAGLKRGGSPALGHPPIAEPYPRRDLYTTITRVILSRFRPYRRGVGPERTATDWKAIQVYRNETRRLPKMREPSTGVTHESVKSVLSPGSAFTDTRTTAVCYIVQSILLEDGRAYSCSFARALCT